jgi:hypothetical protein
VIYTPDDPLCHRLRDRILIDPVTGCWNWQGTLAQNGYPQLKEGGKTVSAHRHACQIMNGKPEDGMDASHLCANRRCVNPNHLIWESHAENMERIVWTKCHAGHEYVKGSWRYSSSGGRTCLICRKEKKSHTRSKGTGDSKS